MVSLLGEKTGDPIQGIPCNDDRSDRRLGAVQ